MSKKDTEFEAKAIKINKEEIRRKLKKLGAKLVFPERLFTRITFDNPILKSENAWVRLRDEGDKITLAYKEVKNKTVVDGMSEIILTVSSLEAAKKFVEKLGVSQKNFQQNYREEWQLSKVIFDLDTWPLIDPWLEIEGPNKKIIKNFFAKLELDFSKAMFGPADVVYREIYGIDILVKPILVF